MVRLTLRSCALALGAMLVIPSIAMADTDEELAKRYYKLGEVLYDRAEYEGALRHFRRSYRHSARPELLYNIARCHESLGQHRKAIEAYREYLATEPPRREIIEQRIANIRRLIAKKQDKPSGEVTSDPAASDGTGPGTGSGPHASANARRTPTFRGTRRTGPDDPGGAIEAPAAAASPGRDAAHQSRPLRMTGWVLVGTGGALVATAIATGVLASSRANEIEAAGDAGKEWSDVAKTRDEGETLETVSLVSGVTGGIAAAAGAVLVLLDWRAARRRGAARRAWVMPGLASGGATLSAGLRF